MNTAHCTFNGTLPTELWSAPSLNLLNATSNQLSGSIPSEIGLLNTKEVLDLSFNPSMVGSIPTEIGDCTALSALNLEGIGLSGSLPSEIGLLSNLAILGLANNDFSGTVPFELEELVNLGTRCYLLQRCV